MARYSLANNAAAGAGSQDGDGGAGGSGGPMPTINVSTGPVMRFANEDYVNQKDFQAGLAQAAKQGAKQGEAKALRRMQMSSATRKQLGM